MAEGDGQGPMRAARIPVPGADLLVPAALLAEVTAYREPEPAAPGSAPVQAGQLAWRGLAVPVVALDALLAPGDPHPRINPRRVVVLYGFSEPAVPFYAVLARDNPRVMEVTEEDLQRTGGPGPYTVMSVRLAGPEEGEALLPDLAALERALARV